MQCSRGQACQQMPFKRDDDYESNFRKFKLGQDSVARGMQNVRAPRWHDKQARDIATHIPRVNLAGAGTPGAKGSFKS